MEENFDEICLEPKCAETEPPKEMPSNFDMLKNFLKSGKDIVGGVMAGEELMVNEETFKARMNVCETCPLFVHETKRCLECGCFMNAKAVFKKTYCPLHKWEAE